MLMQPGRNRSVSPDDELERAAFQIIQGVEHGTVVLVDMQLLQQDQLAAEHLGRLPIPFAGRADRADLGQRIGDADAELAV